MARLIDADELKKLILAERDKIPEYHPSEDYEIGTAKRNLHGDLMRGGIRKALRCMEQCKTVDAIPMPQGRPGDVVEWNNGVEPYEPQYYMIMGIYIDMDSVRYDLGSFSPVVYHKNIVRIIPFDGTPPDGTKTLKVKIPDVLLVNMEEIIDATD